MEGSDSFVGRGGSFVPQLNNSQSSTLSKKIQALESSGFSPDEIAEVFKRLGSASSIGDGSQYRGSISSWMLNYALPSIVILGTGALIFLMTGGEDEPPYVVEENLDDNSDVFVEDDDYPNEARQWPTQLASGRIKDSNSEQDQPHLIASSSSSMPSESSELAALNLNRQRDEFFGEASAAWLQELLLTTNTMAADVKIMKEEIQKMSAAAAVALRLKEKKAEEESKGPATAVATTNDIIDANTVEEVVNKSPDIQLTTADFLLALRLAMRHMAGGQEATSFNIEKIKGSTNATVESALTAKTPMKLGEDGKANIDDQNVIENDENFRKGCGALMMYVGKVLENPSLPRYRKISTSNVSFKSLVLNVKGHADVLGAVGFKTTGSGSSSCFEWIWNTESDHADKNANINSEKESSKVEKLITSVATNPNGTGKPSSDSSRTEILSECMRLLGIGKNEGSEVLLIDLKEKLQAMLDPPVVSSTPSALEETISNLNKTCCTSQTTETTNIQSDENIIKKSDASNINGVGENNNVQNVTDTPILTLKSATPVCPPLTTSACCELKPLGPLVPIPGPEVLEEVLGSVSNQSSDPILQDMSSLSVLPAPSTLRFSDIMRIVASPQDVGPVASNMNTTTTSATDECASKVIGIETETGTGTGG